MYVDPTCVCLCDEQFHSNYGVPVPCLSGSPILGEGSASDLNARRSLGSLSLRSMMHQETPMGKVCWEKQSYSTGVEVEAGRGKGGGVGGKWWE